MPRVFDGPFAGTGHDPGPPRRAGAEGSGRADPGVAFAFVVEIDGVRCARFREASGLEWRTEVVSFPEGGNPRHPVHLIGPGAFTPLVLRRGVTAGSADLFRWLDRVLGRGGPVTRATLALVLLDTAGDEVGRYNLYGAFPSRYTGPVFGDGERGLAVEEVEVTYDRFDFLPAGTGAGALQAGRGER